MDDDIDPDVFIKATDHLYPGHGFETRDTRIYSCNALSIAIYGYENPITDHMLKNSRNYEMYQSLLTPDELRNGGDSLGLDYEGQQHARFMMLILASLIAQEILDQR
jgi:hypothetical protein